jgi:dihydrolipoamide dehydrogenase
MSNQYEVAVIGSGSGGREAALLAGRCGLRTAIIERDKLGGICFHRGCHAVRALQACSRQYRANLMSGRFGSQVDILKATLYDWIIAQTKVSAHLTENLEKELRDLNIDVHMGHAEFLDERSLNVIGEGSIRRCVTADNIVISTGSRPAFYGSSIRKVINSEELLGLKTLPQHLAIIGAGYIGCEFASIFRTLGCDVTLIEAKDRLLPGWEAEAAEHVTQALRGRRVNVMTGWPVHYEQITEKQDCICIPGPNGNHLDADLALVATGRKPNANELGLEALGIKDSSFLKVDEKMQLSLPGVYAVGDVNGLSMLDSTAFAQSNVAIRNILGRESRFEQRWIPRFVHTEPAIAAVGWTEEEAAADGREYLVVKDDALLFSENDRSVIDPEPTFVKVVIDTGSQCLLGCLAVGDHAAVIINTAAIAMRTGLNVDKLREIPLAQPSAADALLSILRKLGYRF